MSHEIESPTPPPAPPASEGIAPNVIPHCITSPTVGKLFHALSLAQKEFPRIEKALHADAVKFSYDYADLADIVQAVAPILGAHGLGVIQPPRTGAKMVFVSTVLFHESGEWIASEPITMPVADGNDPQKVGSALTYARRYSYCAMLGIAPGREDDDGKAAGEQPKGSRRRQEPARPEPERQQTRPAEDRTRIGPKELKRLNDAMKEHKVSREHMAAFLSETYQYNGWNEIERRHYDAIMTIVQQGGPKAAPVGDLVTASES